ncbi:Alanine racemase [Roseibacterium elongatum DSM 19469]|uniref:Alanine racemase n=1 Tax=Roseicyclus elongatus DSM 19469 TaxID=1294273 RepID=W8S7B1_9RHOB|nr:alanine racemase [Roseibacterium elongatum]AHM04821.1 Alanine racemase [Roseibacterium elongatum DSM 19469]
MGTGTLHIDLDALAANWRALDARTGCETAAVVKADGYGLGAARAATALARAGARRFFVATAEEGATLRAALGQGPEINVFSGHMATDTALIRDANLTPMLNDAAQLARHRAALPQAAYGVQLDSGMNRLGMEPADWAALRGQAEAGPLTLVMSHLAYADEPDHPQNAEQLRQFTEMTAGVSVPRSLAATGGILLGPDYHFDLTRPGIGLYGGLPFDAAQPVVRLSLPVIQTRDVMPGEHVGYGCTFTAARPTKIATLSAGYADGLIRAMSGKARLFAGNTPCPLAGRVSMDLLTVDVTDLPETPEALDILCPSQTVDHLAEATGTIGYEILTSLGPRYARRYAGETA